LNYLCQTASIGERSRRASCRWRNERRTERCRFTVLLGSKVSSVVAERLEHSRPGPGQRPSQANVCPSIVSLRPPHNPGFSLEAPSLIRSAHKARAKRVSAPDSLQTRREAEDADSHRELFVVACADDIAKHHHQGTHGRQDVARKLCSSAEASLSDRRTGKAGAVNHLDPPRSACTITYLGHV
jgi:hypothetical protein